MKKKEILNKLALQLENLESQLIFASARKRKFKGGTSSIYHRQTGKEIVLLEQIKFLKTLV